MTFFRCPDFINERRTRSCVPDTFGVGFAGRLPALCRWSRWQYFFSPDRNRTVAFIFRLCCGVAGNLGRWQPRWHFFCRWHFATKCRWVVACKNKTLVVSSFRVTNNGSDHGSNSASLWFNRVLNNEFRFQVQIKKKRREHSHGSRSQSRRYPNYNFHWLCFKLSK